MESSIIFDPAESIEYSDGSVVSKTIIKKNAGNITLFAFDKDEGLAAHSSPYEALVFLLSGKVEITIGHEPQLLKDHDCIILPANIPHSLKAIEKFKMMLVMIKD